MTETPEMREKRLAQALRANLRRRKAAARNSKHTELKGGEADAKAASTPDEP